MPTTFVDDIFAAFSRYGDDRYGETVTQRQHALQSADLASAMARPSLVVAALLHDYGHS